MPPSPVTLLLFLNTLEYKRRLCNTAINRPVRTLTAAPGLSNAAVLEAPVTDVPHADCSLWPTDNTLGQCGRAYRDATQATAML